MIDIQTQKNVGVLLVNLGSPESPDPVAVGRYLGEFLMDEHVIDLPRPVRQLLVRGMIVPFRSRRSARAYRSIWRDDGSPLIVISRKLTGQLQRELEVPVEVAMRYGQPSIEEGLKKLHTRCGSDLRDVFVVPLYPHYAMSTVRSIEVAVEEALLRTEMQVNVTVKETFYQDTSYIHALAESIHPYVEEPFDHILFSYHGLPERHLKKTDPTGAHCLRVENCCNVASSAHRYCYRHQVFDTTNQVTKTLNIPDEKWSNAFQSRLGPDSWLKPFAAERVEGLAAAGVSKLLVVCPAFVSDCLETLEEVGIGMKRMFLDAGGRSFQLIPCLNDHAHWIEALRGWCVGWQRDVEQRRTADEPVA
ncbi:MAG: ferrochelatase [bacterium]|nr:ferrochelatase [bacterium]